MFGGSCRPGLQPVIATPNQQERRLELHGGGVIEMWSLDSPDAGRGRAYAVIVIDECALVPNLESVAANHPADADRFHRPSVVSDYTQGHESFKALFDRGQDPLRREWASGRCRPARIRISTRRKSRRTSRHDGIGFQPGISAVFISWEAACFGAWGTRPRFRTGGGPKRDMITSLAPTGAINDYTVFLVLT